MSARARKIQSQPDELERLNVSKLALQYDLDRATVLKRLDLAKIYPVEEHAKLKLFEVTPKLEAVLGAIHDPLAEVKLRAATADAEYRETKVAAMRGDLVPYVEAVELTREIVGGLYRDLAAALPKRVAPRLARMKTAAEVQRFLKLEIEKVFRAIRDTPESVLK